MSDQSKPEGPAELAGLRDLVKRFYDRAEKIERLGDHGDDDNVALAVRLAEIGGLRSAASIIEDWGRDMAQADAKAAAPAPELSMLCRKCAAINVVSIVVFLPRNEKYYKRADYSSFYRNGVAHYHRGTSTSQYACEHGHAWRVKHRQGCSASGCAWVDQIERADLPDLAGGALETVQQDVAKMKRHEERGLAGKEASRAKL